MKLRRRESRAAAVAADDLTVDLLRLSAGLVTLAVAIVLGLGT